MTDYGALVARMFPVDPIHLEAAIARLRATSSGWPMMLTQEQARAVLHALMNFEARAPMPTGAAIQIQHDPGDPNAPPDR